MIEIKDGWTAQEAYVQDESARLKSKIAMLNSQLEQALEARAQLQTSCKHNHVIFAGQEMTCEVCEAKISQ